MRVRRSLLRGALGTAISVLFIWLTLRDKDLHAIWEATRVLQPVVLVEYLGILLLIHVLRMLRWGILLERMGTVRLARLNRAMAVGAMALMTLPFRLGELARPYLISERFEPAGPGETPIRMSAATATIVIERVVDGIFTSAILIAALLLTTSAQDAHDVRMLRNGGLLIGGAFAAVGLGLLVLLWQRERAVAAISRLLSLVSERLAERAAESLESFIGGVAEFPRPARLALFLGMTVVYWGVNGAGMLLLARGFGLSLDLAQAYALLGVLVIGVMIPAGPGMVGTFQFFVVLGLGLYLPKAEVDAAGVAYANVLWAAQFGQQVGLGLVFLLARPQSLAALSGGRADT